MGFVCIRRPELIFDKFIYVSNYKNTQNCVNGLELLLGKCETLILNGINFKSTILHKS